MIAELGGFLGLLALVLALSQGALGLVGGHRDDARLSAAAAAAAQACAVALLVSFAALIALFVRSDFSVAVVANNSHTFKPLIYKIAGVWGNHEGSMLLWCLISATFGAMMANLRGGISQGVWSRAVGIQGLVTAAALAYTLFLSSPFARLDPAPLQGGDLNPLLQDPALAIHPPMLYLGYVGMSAPFSLALGALIAGQVDQGWARAVRPWALAAWTFLTIGIALGSYWAYYELGWGGWWFWDPVENASFMPWLAAAALLHSAIVTERRGSLASWTILLAILAFGLALLGTFLVRSGVLTSVHAFAVDPRRGVAVLTMLAVALGAGLALYAWRAPSLARPAGFVAVSRDGALLANNLGLAVATGTVLVGTLYPLLVDAISNEIISVGPPYFNATFGPLMAAMFVILPFAPFLTWRKGDAAYAARQLWLAGAVAVAGLVAVALLWKGAFWVSIGVGLGLWLIVGAFTYVWKRWGQGGARTPARLLALPLAVWAMSLAHAGLGVMTIGAVAETGFRSEKSVRLAPGESTDFAGRTVKLLSVDQIEGPNYYGDRARLDVSLPGKAPQRAAPERRLYPAAGSGTSEVAILSDWTGDYYIALGEPSRTDGGQAGWTVRLYKNPLVHLIFVGALMMALGGVCAMTGLARARRRAPAPEPAAQGGAPQPVAAE
ncbi:MAG: heme lyase CcmF/NrfE family subunit [Alphaproteobacteria bacterium]|nr:heme lyase CcmF/NrfE family subunit [Alphaproteobacteria bacterium]